MMTYRNLTPAEQGILASTIDTMLGHSDDTIADELIDTIQCERMCPEEDSMFIAYDAITVYFKS